MDLISLIKKYGAKIDKGFRIPGEEIETITEEYWELALPELNYYGTSIILQYDVKNGISLGSYWGIMYLINYTKLMIDYNKPLIHSGNNSVLNEKELFINMAQQVIDKILLKEKLEKNLPVKNKNDKINKI